MHLFISPDDVIISLQLSMFGDKKECEQTITEAASTA
jgi:hypothetical protein